MWFKSLSSTYWKNMYENECKRSLYWQQRANFYEMEVLKAVSTRRAPEKGVRRLVEKVKKLKAELALLREVVKNG